MKNKVFRIFSYFIIYSVIGFLLETVYAIFTKGVIESRQSFLYGPFCIVYGIGAICLIVLLRKYKNKNIKLFFYGMIIGCFVEYFSSFFGEVILHVKWWDYSNDFLNINGRTCLFYAVIWGILSIILINHINPFFEKIILKINQKKFGKIVVILLILFMILDGSITCLALENFLVRVATEYDMSINGIDNMKPNLKLFSNEQMIKIYPNIMVVSKRRRYTLRKCFKYKKLLL